mgnify:FL=1
MAEIFEFPKGYQLQRGEVGDRILRILYCLIKNEKIVRVWWDNEPTPPEITEIIDQIIE